MNCVHILLIEDNVGDVLLTTEALKDSSIQNTLSIARDGWEAMQYLEKKDPFIGARMPDLILLDVNLPKKNGHEVLINIKTNEKLKHIPVIMLTTSSSPKDIFKSYYNHANCYITKPTAGNDFSQLIGAIKKFWIEIAQLPSQIT